jgi:hypothetical protein
MKSNIFKKIISLTCLIIFLSGIFIPFNQSFAQIPDLTLTPDKSSYKPGDTATITAVTYGDSSMNFIFTSSPNGGTFIPATAFCTPNKGTAIGIGYYKLSCTIGFQSPSEGTFTIKASLGTLNSSGLTLSFKVPTPLNCVSPAKPNDAGTACVTPTDTTYTPLAPLPDFPGVPYNTAGSCPFGTYLNIIIKLVIGFAAVLAMVMITMGGIEYMTAELVSGKEEGKERITHALLGLLLALGSFLILNTINPQLLNACLNKLPPAIITVADLGGENTTIPFQPISQTTLQDNFGITLCNGTGGKSAVADIGKQFMPQTEYSQTARNTVNSSTIFVDCSSFVDQVYACAGLANPGDNSNAIFSNNATAVDVKTYDFNQLHSGDLVGWKPSDDPNGNGHVAIYLGGGKILDTQDTNNPTAIRNLSSIQSRIKYVKWP